MRLFTFILTSVLCLSIWCMGNDPSWTPIAVVPATLDGMFYSGTQFIGYRLSPTLDIYCSDNGTNWIRHASVLQPLSVGHDGRGNLYALTRTSTSSTPGWYSYTAHLWRSTDAQNWHFLTDLVSYFEIIPTRAYFIANEESLLVKLNNSWGAGWVSGSPPQPLFMANRTTPTNFVEVTNGDDLNSILVSDGHFIATREGSPDYAVHSTNGTIWTEMFSLGSSYPSRAIVSTWQSLYFIHGYWTSLAVQNQLSERLDVNTPVNFSHGLNSLRDVIYDGKRLILVGDDVCYCSEDYAQTWNTNLFISVCGSGANNGIIHLLGDCTGTETVIYRLTSTNDVAEVQETSLSLNITPTHEIELYPAMSNQLYQLECSENLTDWHIYGLPTTCFPFTVNSEVFNHKSMFFRTKNL